MHNIFQPKLFSLLRQGIPKEQIVKDILAGVVVAIVALPLAIAFAVASGVSPEKGLVTAIVAGFIISFLGGSRVQIGGPTGAFIVIIFAIVQEYGIDGLIISTVMSGIFLVVFGFLRLGSLLKYFPHPLIVGFTSAIAVIIFSTQVKDALGLQIDTMPGGFTEKWILYFSSLHQISLYAPGVTVATILITIYSKKFTTKIPGAFFAIIFLTLGVQLFKIPVTTIETFFGEIPSEISFVVPNVDWSMLHIYIAPALTIAILGSVESLLSAVVADGMISSKHRSNTELIAQGTANIVTPFFGGIPATGAIARTATNVKNGGRTPIAGIVHALTLLLIMMLFASYAKLIPMAVLAGVLIVVAYNMSEWRSFISILKGSKFDVIILLSTFFLTIFVDLTVAIQIGVVLSALLFMKRMSDIALQGLPKIDSDVLEDYSHLPKGVSIYEISGPLFFGSANEYAQVIKKIGLQNKILILRMRHVPFVDATALHNLSQTIQTLQSAGVTLILSGVNDAVMTELKASRLIDDIKEENILDSFSKALQRAKALL
jgi:SulP family sulfate permease